MTLSVADLPAVESPGEGGSGEGPRADRPRRRVFTAEYKHAVLEEYERLTEPGAKGALLRREGLYSSHLIEWRRARDAGALAGMAAQPSRRSGKTLEQRENERLVAENARLAAELARTKAALEIVGKAHALLELLSDSSETRRPGRPGQRVERVERVEQVIEAAFTELTEGGLASARAACQLLGKPRSSHYRRLRPAPPGQPNDRQTGDRNGGGPDGDQDGGQEAGQEGRRSRRRPSNALSDAERARVLDLLRSGRFVDKAPGAGVGHPAGRGGLPVQPVHHVPAATRPRRGARTAPAGPAPGEGQARAGGLPAQRGLVLGHHEAARPGPRACTTTCT